MSDENIAAKDDAGLRIEFMPERPAVFTIRVTLLDGRAVLAEKRQEYADLYGALSGLRTVGEDLAALVSRDALSTFVPRGENNYDDDRSSQESPNT